MGGRGGGGKLRVLLRNCFDVQREKKKRNLDRADRTTHFVPFRGCSSGPSARGQRFKRAIRKWN